MCNDIVPALKMQVAQNPEQNLTGCGFDGDEFDEDETTTVQVKTNFLINKEHDLNKNNKPYLTSENQVFRTCIRCFEEVLGRLRCSSR